MRERDVERYLKKRVEDLGGEVRKVKWVGRRNAPDRLVMLRMYHAFVELKRPGKEATPAQMREHERLRVAGFEVYEISSISQVDWFLTYAQS